LTAIRGTAPDGQISSANPALALIKTWRAASMSNSALLMKPSGHRVAAKSRNGQKGDLRFYCRKASHGSNEESRKASIAGQANFDGVVSCCPYQEQVGAKEAYV
jgi:hypothetical protein